MKPPSRSLTRPTCVWWRPSRALASIRIQQLGVMEGAPESGGLEKSWWMLFFVLIAKWPYWILKNPFKSDWLWVGQLLAQTLQSFFPPFGPRKNPKTTSFQSAERWPRLQDRGLHGSADEARWAHLRCMDSHQRYPTGDATSEWRVRGGVHAMIQSWWYNIPSNQKASFLQETHADNKYLIRIPRENSLEAFWSYKVPPRKTALCTNCICCRSLGHCFLRKSPQEMGGLVLCRSSNSHPGHRGFSEEKQSR